jgi:hypothetical protein
MHEKDLSSWEEFEEQLKELNNERNNFGTSDDFIFRGVERKSYRLETTLERYVDKNITLKDYYDLIFLAQYEIHSFGGDKWDIKSKIDFRQWLQLWDSAMESAFGTVGFQNIYSYMVYLRHYGFPSPLLDWSISPYVAAYFAFRNIQQKKEDVSIYVYLESKNKYKLGNSDRPYIRLMGPYIITDQRHFIQQSRYTMCIVRDTNLEGEWRYVPHEEAFNNIIDHDQDILWKFNIPYTERFKVLKLLDLYNINAMSLFRSKESLMETMALRRIYFKQSN